MSIVIINEMMDEGSRSLNWNLQSGRSYQRRFRVLTDSQDDGPVVVMSALGLAYGDRYNPSYNSSEADLFAYNNSITCDAAGDDGIEWIVTANYSWYDPLQAGGGQNQNPLLMPIEVSWDMRDLEAALDRDIDGNPILNTAFDPYDPPLMTDDTRLTMTIVRNEAAFNLGWVLTYKGAIATDPFAGLRSLLLEVFEHLIKKHLASRRRILLPNDLYVRVSQSIEPAPPLRISPAGRQPGLSCDQPRDGQALPHHAQGRAGQLAHAAGPERLRARAERHSVLQHDQDVPGIAVRHLQLRPQGDHGPAVRLS